MARRTVEQYNWDALQFDETILDKHFTKHTNRQIKFVVIHHMVVRDKDVNDDDALDACYNIWQTRKASAHYGVDGRFVRQFVWDGNEAWATGSNEGNDHGISIEHVNMTLDEAGSDRDYLVSDETWKNGAKLAAYIHKAKKLGRPRDGVTLRKHKEFKATSCPGPYLGEKIWPQYVAETQRVYDQITSGQPNPTPAPTPAPTNPGGKSISQLADEVIAGKHGIGTARKRSLGSKYKAVQAEVNRRLSGRSAAKKVNISALADAVMRGEYGNGPERKRRLGSNYAAVQAEVNRRLR